MHLRRTFVSGCAEGNKNETLCALADTAKAK
jgi:hypothetical protein